MIKQFSSTDELLNYLISERNFQKDDLEEVFEDFFKECFESNDFETLANNKQTFYWFNQDGEEVEAELVFGATMSKDDEFVFVITLL